MSLDPIGLTTTIVSFTWKVANIIIQMQAADENARSLLQLAENVNVHFEQTRKLRRTYSGLLGQEEKQIMDETTFPEVQSALDRIIRLVRNAKIDYEVRGSMTARHRLWYYLFSETAVTAAMQQLVVANSHLTSENNVIRIASRIHAGVAQSRSHSMIRRNASIASFHSLQPGLPPPYSLEPTIYHTESNETNTSYLSPINSPLDQRQSRSSDQLPIRDPDGLGINLGNMPDFQGSTMMGLTPSSSSPNLAAPELSASPRSFSSAEPASPGPVTPLPSPGMAQPQLVGRPVRTPSTSSGQLGRTGRTRHPSSSFRREHPLKVSSAMGDLRDTVPEWVKAYRTQ